MTACGEVLVAILNNPLDLAVARDEHWYRIPVSSVDKWLRGRWTRPSTRIISCRCCSTSGCATSTTMRWRA